VTIALIECFPFQIVKEVTRVIPQPDVSSAHLSASSLFEDGLLLAKISKQQEQHDTKNPEEREVNFDIQPRIDIGTLNIQRSHGFLAVLYSVDVLRIDDWEHVANDHPKANDCLSCVLVVPKL
jgi:hypothetical protein